VLKQDVVHYAGDGNETKVESQDTDLVSSLQRQDSPSVRHSLSKIVRIFALELLGY
jgi:hypothetical protein